MNGKFKGRVVGTVVLGESKNKGTPYIQFLCEITEDGKEKGKRVRFETYFASSASSELAIEALQACGWDGEDLGEFKDGALHGLDRNEVELVIEEEDYEVSVIGEDGSESREKRTTSRVKYINPIRGAKLNVDNAMSPEKASVFGEQMRALVLKSKKKTAPSEAGDFNFGANVPKNQEAQQAAGNGRKF